MNAINRAGNVTAVFTGSSSICSDDYPCKPQIAAPPRNITLSLQMLDMNGKYFILFEQIRFLNYLGGILVRNSQWLLINKIYWIINGQIDIFF